jgi:hypothetical protein
MRSRAERVTRPTPRVRRSDVPLYRYGWLAWVWRAFIAAGLALGGLLLLTSVATLNPLLLVGALALIGPSLFFGVVLVVSADRRDDGTLEIGTLLFGRRRIHPSRLGPPVVRVLYRTIYANLSAPRVWVSVKGGLPLYFDLLGRIVNRQALLAAIGLRAAEIQRAQ